MDQVGYITSINGNIAEISIKRSSSCGDKCGSCKGGCSVQGISVKSKNTLGAKVGDYVEIRTQTNIVLKSAFIVYILPLIMLIIGVFIGITVFEKLGFENYESLGFIVGLIFLSISYFVLKSIDKRIKNKNQINFEIVNIVNNKRI
ncbi:SoxR reducing system RseC family protein [Brassicibacter mesophilus]|uniref:SoxR reducing system RseC family protein n=1 Tax=Brassicibacter mesophilus TaxID=745119 RepID=UPI003D1F585A